MLCLQLTPDGFYLEAHSKLLPVDSATKGGIFYAGCAVNKWLDTSGYWNGVSYPFENIERSNKILEGFCSMPRNLSSLFLPKRIFLENFSRKAGRNRNFCFQMVSDCRPDIVPTGSAHRFPSFWA